MALQQRWILGACALLSSLLALCNTAKAGGTFNVKSYGAGGGDSAGAFVAAFEAACKAGGGTVFVPPGVYTVQPFAVAGCSYITFQVEGTILAPMRGDMGDWKGKGKGKGLYQFDWMDHLTITGGGTFDGRASFDNWWNSGGGKAPITLSFTHCEDLKLLKFTVRNTPGTAIQVDLQMIEGQWGLTVDGLTVDSHGDSPNTDAIHLSHLWNAVVRNSHLACGDDTVVFQTDCKNILVENVHSTAGNGISLGSLGNGVDSCMNNILVQDCSFANTNNGARIKCWENRGGGAATGITFRNIQMTNVKNPIIVSQCYSGGTAKDCGYGGSSVAVYDVLFENIHGTCNPSQECVTISCTGGTPCTGITLRNINLVGGGVSCINAYGSEQGVRPGGCLSSGDPSSGARSSAARTVAVCGYGSAGYYAFSGPGAPGSPLRRGGGGGGSAGKPKPKPRPRPRPRPLPRRVSRRRGRKGGMRGRKGMHPKGRGMRRKGTGMHKKKHH